MVCFGFLVKFCRLTAHCAQSIFTSSRRVQIRSAERFAPLSVNHWWVAIVFSSDLRDGRGEWLWCFCPGVNCFTGKLACIWHASSTLWWTNILPWKITIFYGKIHYKSPFSIAMLVHQRVSVSSIQKKNKKKRIVIHTTWKCFLRTQLIVPYHSWPQMMFSRRYCRPEAGWWFFGPAPEKWMDPLDLTLWALWAPGPLTVFHSCKISNPFELHLVDLVIWCDRVPRSLRASLNLNDLERYKHREFLRFGNHHCME